MKALIAPLGLLLASPAGAQAFSGGDWAWSIAAGTGGATLGGLAAAAVGAASASDGDDLYGLDATLGALVALPLGLDLGAAGAVFAYGELSGHDGGFLATLAGGTVGTLVGIGFLAGLSRAHEDLWVVGTVGLLVSPAVGATVGYRLSVGDGAGPPAAGALVGYLPEVGWHLSVPALGARPGACGELAVGLPVLAGRF